MSKSAVLGTHISRLLVECDELEDSVQYWQSESPGPSQADIRAMQVRYAGWFARALDLIPESDRPKFVEMNEGRWMKHRIRVFLADPLAVSPLYAPDAQPIPLLSRWKAPFSTTFRESLAVQREILARALHDGTNVSVVLDELADQLRRFPAFFHILEHHANVRVPAPSIENESDPQVAIHALLQLLYADVRAEDPMPQSAGASSRVDFLLRERGVMVETKMMRPSLSDKKVGEELLVDWGRYPRHPDCRALFALIFDPKRQLKNPTALASGFRR